jgi:hypothetical protein
VRCWSGQYKSVYPRSGPLWEPDLLGNCAETAALATYYAGCTLSITNSKLSTTEISMRVFTITVS